MRSLNDEPNSSIKQKGIKENGAFDKNLIQKVENTFAMNYENFNSEERDDLSETLRPLKSNVVTMQQRLKQSCLFRCFFNERSEQGNQSQASQPLLNEGDGITPGM